MSGLFVTFEGIEGSGKTTQVRLVEAWLKDRGHSVCVVREPGGTMLSEQIRGLLLARGAVRMDPWAELCLYEAARAQLVQEVIRPKLDQGVIVLGDRFADASVAYQGGGRGLGVAPVRTLNRAVTRGLTPARTILFDLDPVTGLERIRTRRGAGLDRLESEPMAFHQRVRRTYLQMARREPERFVVLDAMRPVEELAVAVRDEIACLL